MPADQPTFRIGCEAFIGGAEGPLSCLSATQRLRVALDNKAATISTEPITGTVCRCGQDNANAEFNVAVMSSATIGSTTRVVMLIVTEPGAAVPQTHIEYVVVHGANGYLVDDIRCGDDDPATSIYVAHPPMCS